jgi:hypothetical protein
MSGDISEAHEIALLTERYDADVSILEADAPRLTDAFDPASQTGANLAQGAIRRRVRDAAMRLVMTCEAIRKRATDANGQRYVELDEVLKDAERMAWVALIKIGKAR